MTNKVFIATSLDGYIADENNKIDWLNEIPNPNNIDCGFANFIENIDALVMGRNTFESVLGFDCEWPYTKPVFVLSNKLKTIPSELKEQVHLMSGTPLDITTLLNQQGYINLYIDGGYTIQKYLEYNLIHEMIITVLPILLGGGTRLFASPHSTIRFNHINTQVYLDSIVQSHYIAQ